LSDVLKDVAVLKLGRTEALNGLFKRVLHIVRDPSGRRFVPASQVGA